MNLRQRFSNDLIETLADSEHALARDLGANREMLSVAPVLLLERGLERGLHRALRQMTGTHRDLVIRRGRR